MVPSSDSISEVSSQYTNPSVDYAHHKDMLCIPPQSHEDVETVTSGNVSFLTDSLLPQASIHNGNSESAFGDDELIYEENDSMPTAVQDSELLNEEMDQEQRVDDDIASLGMDDWETNAWDQESGQSGPKNGSDVSFSLENESAIQRSGVDDSQGSSQELKSVGSTEDSRVGGEEDLNVGDEMDSHEDEMDSHEDEMDSHEDDLDSHEEDEMDSHDEDLDMGDNTSSQEDLNVNYTNSHMDDMDSHEEDLDVSDNMNSHEDSQKDEMESRTDGADTLFSDTHTDMEASSHIGNVSSYADSVESHSSDTEASLGESDLPADDAHLDQLSVTEEDSKKALPIRVPSSLVPTSVLRKKMATKSKPTIGILRPKESPLPVKTPSEASSSSPSETPLVLSTSDLFLNSTPTSPASVCFHCHSDP